MRRKKNRVYPSPEAVSRAPDSRERLRKSTVCRATLTARAAAHVGVVVVRLACGGGPGAQTPHRRAYGPYAIRTFARASGSRACTRTQATHLVNLTPVT